MVASIPITQFLIKWKLAFSFDQMRTVDFLLVHRFKLERRISKNLNLYVDM